MAAFKTGDRVFLKGTLDLWHVIDGDLDGMVMCRRFRDDKFEKHMPGMLDKETPPGSLGHIPAEYFDPAYTPSPVISAGYGAGAGKNWMDVTEIIRDQYAAGRRHFVASNHEFDSDPFGNVTKCLSIVLVHGNKIHTFVITEHTPGTTLPG